MKQEDLTKKGLITASLVWSGIGAAIFFYFGGWEILWNGKPFSVLDWSRWGESSYYGNRGWLFKFNSGWYGVYRTERFFDGPFVQWMILAASFINLLTFLGEAIKILILYMKNTFDTQKDASKISVSDNGSGAKGDKSKIQVLDNDNAAGKKKEKNISYDV
jgi:hypothetical protein